MKEYEGIDTNKSNKSKECMICYYWYFNYEPHVCNGCHDVDYRCFVFNMSKDNVINRLNNSKLDDEGTL